MPFVLELWGWAGYFASLSLSFSCVKWGCSSSSHEGTVIIRDEVREVLSIVTASCRHSGNGRCCHPHPHQHCLHYNHRLNMLIIVISTFFIHRHHPLHCLPHPYFLQSFTELWSEFIFVLAGNISFRKTKRYLFCVCLLETFAFEIIAFPDRTLSSAGCRVIAAAATTLKGFQGRVNGGMHGSEDCSPLGSWDWLSQLPLITNQHKDPLLGVFTA